MSARADLCGGRSAMIVPTARSVLALLDSLRSGSGLSLAFMLLNCWGGLRHALALLRLARLPRREGFACPWLP
jgi:hypothetical protein